MTARDRLDQSHLLRPLRPLRPRDLEVRSDQSRLAIRWDLPDPRVQWHRSRPLHPLVPLLPLVPLHRWRPLPPLRLLRPLLPLLPLLPRHPLHRWRPLRRSHPLARVVPSGRWLRAIPLILPVLFRLVDQLVQRIPPDLRVQAHPPRPSDQQVLQVPAVREDLAPRCCPSTPTTCR